MLYIIGDKSCGAHTLIAFVHTAYCTGILWYSALSCVHPSQHQGGELCQWYVVAGEKTGHRERRRLGGFLRVSCGGFLHGKGSLEEV